MMRHMYKSELRKERSIAILKKQNIPYIEHLPVITDKHTSLRRSTEEVAYRAMVLQTVAVKAEGLEQEIVQEIIHHYKLDSYFTTKEREFIYNNNIDETTRIQFLWKYEAYWTLLWALGFVEQLEYPDKICDVPLAVSLLSERGAKQFLKEAKLRAQDEILDQADLIYRYHWATRNNRIKGIEPPAGLDNSVIMERHYTLNWLIDERNTDWDDISTNT
ncbi:MAG: DUF4272 domain-containing protein [Rickettsiales bacterium]|nr:DUF4272 domain-containing protein [Rickettsiales bacterium]